MHESEVLKNKPQLQFSNVLLLLYLTVNGRKAVSMACIHTQETGMLKPAILPRQKLLRGTILAVKKAGLENCAYCLNKNTTDEWM